MNPDAEQYHRDQASNGLQRIIDIKRTVLDGVELVRHAALNDYSHASHGDLAFYEAATEESFDDLFAADWKRLTEISGCITWPMHIPSFKDLRQGKYRRDPAKQIFDALKPSSPMEQLANLRKVPNQAMSGFNANNSAHSIDDEIARENAAAALTPSAWEGFKAAVATRAERAGISRRVVNCGMSCQEV